MFESVGEIREGVEKVHELFAGRSRGEVVPHDEIEAILGITRHTGRWKTILDRVRARLQREDGIATWPEVGVGYKLLTVREQIEELPGWRLARAARQSRRGLRSVAAIPNTDLTQHQRRVRQAHVDAMRRATAAVARHRREMDVLTKPREHMPRPRRPDLVEA